MATMNISLPDSLKEWAESRVGSGRYSNVSDYVRDLIRREQDRLTTILEIQERLDEGEASGYTRYSREELERKLKDSTAQDAA
ncbi:MAG: type II toxin-antitoxin system ParD family antitoxin [Hyphomicrobiales bacterium]